MENNNESENELELFNVSIKNLNIRRNISAVLTAGFALAGAYISTGVNILDIPHELVSATMFFVSGINFNSYRKDSKMAKMLCKTKAMILEERNNK